MSAAPAAPSPAPAGTDAVWAVIPARYASTRFPGKPLVAIQGRPMIQHVYERTLRTPSVRRVLVATDDERIAAAVRAFGGEVVLTGEAATGTDRIAEAVTREAERGAAPGWVLNVQGDEPLIDPADLERLVSGLLAAGGVMGTLVYPLEDTRELNDPNVVKAVLDAHGRALYFSRAPIPYPRAAESPAEPKLGWRHLGVYLYRTDFLHTFHRLPPTPLSEREQLEQLRALEHGHAIHAFQARTKGIGVDVPADLPRAEAMLAALGKAGA